MQQTSEPCTSFTSFGQGAMHKLARLMTCAKITSTGLVHGEDPRSDWSEPRKPSSRIPECAMFVCDVGHGNRSLRLQHCCSASLIRQRGQRNSRVESCRASPTNDCFVGSRMQTSTTMSRRNQSAKHWRWNLSERPGLVHVKEIAHAFSACTSALSCGLGHMSTAKPPYPRNRGDLAQASPLHSTAKLVCFNTRASSGQMLHSMDTRFDQLGPRMSLNESRVPQTINRETQLPARASRVPAGTPERHLWYGNACTYAAGATASSHSSLVQILVLQLHPNYGKNARKSSGPCVKLLNSFLSSLTAEG